MRTETTNGWAVLPNYAKIIDYCEILYIAQIIRPTSLMHSFLTPQVLPLMSWFRHFFKHGSNVDLTISQLKHWLASNLIIVYLNF